MCIGVTAALISIITEWLSDIKMGYCSDGWWLNQQFCCWEIEYDNEDACDSWHSWSEVGAARWFVYVVFAVCVVPPCLVSLDPEPRSLGPLLVHSRAPREERRKVRGWLWDFRDQVHHRRVRYEGLPGLLDVRGEGHHTGMPSSLCPRAVMFTRSSHSLLRPASQ